jgi:hypothetical protein
MCIWAESLQLRDFLQKQILLTQFDILTLTPYSNHLWDTQYVMQLTVFMLSKTRNYMSIGLPDCNTMSSCGCLPMFMRNIHLRLQAEKKILVTTYKTTDHHNPEDQHQHLQSFQNIKSRMKLRLQIHLTFLVNTQILKIMVRYNNQRSLQSTANMRKICQPIGTDTSNSDLSEKARN